MIAKTEGIVLKSFDFRETSRIATFFTLDFGKVKGVLKGIRTDPKKFGSSVESFSVNDLVYYRHRHSDLHLVSHCDMKEYFYPLRSDLTKMTAASYALELVDAVMPVEEQNAGIYRLMQDFFKSLQTARDAGQLVHAFQIKILSLSGFRPHLENCVRCPKMIDGPARFSLKHGGLLCAFCQGAAGTVAISKGAVASILHIQRTPWPAVLRLALSAPIKKELKYVLNHFLVFHLERHLRSTRFLS